MFTRKVDRRFLSAPQWCAMALILSCTTAASAQFGGMGGMGGAQPAEQRVFPNGLPKMELMLKAALEHHPDVLAARSKLRAAEAEQRQAEFKALKDILDVRDRWEKANRSVGEGNPGENPAMVRDRLAAVAAVEWELAFLLGTRGETAVAPKADGEKGAPQADAAPATVMVESAIPRGEKAKMIKEKLGKQITLSGDEVPLTELVKLLSQKSGLRFLLDKQALEDEGYPADSPITIDLGELELGAVLEVLEDLHKTLHFVVRDYGILVTTGNERSSSKVSATDFWKLTDEELRDKLRHQREEELRESTGGMGGMGGGMMGGGMGGGGVF